MVLFLHLINHFGDCYEHKTFIFQCRSTASCWQVFDEFNHPIGVEFNKRFLNKYSGDKLDNITIIFICTDEEMLSDGFYPERRYISWKNKYADIRLIIPYLQFINADNDTRKKMMWDVIERSLDYIRKRKAFVGIDELERDLHTVYWSV